MLWWIIAEGLNIESTSRFLEIVVVVVVVLFHGLHKGLQVECQICLPALSHILS